MEVTQEMIHALLAMSDKELAPRFAAIAAALGMSEKMAAASTPRFRGMLAATSPDELTRMLNALGEEKKQEILKGVGGEGS